MRSKKGEPMPNWSSVPELIQMAFREAYEEREAGAIDEDWRIKVIKATHGFANRFCGTPSPRNVARAIAVLKQVERARRVLDRMKKDIWMGVKEAHGFEGASPVRYNRRMPVPPPRTTTTIKTKTKGKRKST